jgi:hypothetical protein
MGEGAQGWSLQATLSTNEPNERVYIEEKGREAQAHLRGCDHGQHCACTEDILTPREGKCAVEQRL